MELEVGSQVNLYQVHFSEEKVGKMMKNSKMKVTWNFRESDSEHMISLIWSKTTGKQQIEMDGTLIWFGRNQGRSVLDHDWTTRDERPKKLHMLATCAPKVNENFRNFDLVINGQLYAALPHYGREGSNAPIPPPMGKDNLNSIIQILYPDGYVPPVGKEQQERQEGHHQHNIVEALPQRDNAMENETVIAKDHTDKNDNTDSSSSSSDLVVDLLGEDNMILAPPVQQQQQQQVMVDLLG